MHEGNYGMECDVWSCGVVLYVLLSGNYPYNASTVSLIYERIQKKAPEFPFSIWGKLSDEVQDLLTGMLQRLPLNRTSLEDCLKHKWFKIAEKIGSDSSPRGRFNSLSLSFPSYNK